ncbi:MAG: hypothetical protein M1827_003056 [Pycnora praestabilis]|nr:MAG: hypothetical protein M1827_003056 [Pycnora praestabilis]
MSPLKIPNFESLSAKPPLITQELSPLSMPRKTVLITGCNEGGIGDALAKSLAKRDVRVFASGRTMAKVAHLENMGIETLALDVTSPGNANIFLPVGLEDDDDDDDDDDDGDADETGAVASSQQESFFRPLANAFSTLPPAEFRMPTNEGPTETAHEPFNVNIFGVVAVTQAFTPQLIRTGGIIINTGSIPGIVPEAYQGMYDATRAALAHLSATLRADLAPRGVHVVNVVTGQSQDIVDVGLYAEKVVGNVLHRKPGKQEPEEWICYQGVVYRYGWSAGPAAQERFADPADGDDQLSPGWQVDMIMA